MKIFVSWSGPQSKDVAELLKDWLPHVVQRAELYVSSQDIEKGERWAASISTHLSDIDFGIIVVTPSNLEAPWVNFEAGALSKSVKSRVIPLLCGMERIDAASSPLRQFQYALANRTELLRLVVAVNEATEKPLDNTRVEFAFDRWWPDFEEAYNQIDFNIPTENSESDGDPRLSKIENALEAIMGDLSRMRREVQQQNRTISSADIVRVPASEQWEANFAEVRVPTADVLWHHRAEIPTVTSEDISRVYKRRLRPDPKVSPTPGKRTTSSDDE